MKTFMIMAALLGVASTANYAQWNRMPEVNGAVYLNDGTELLIKFAYHEKEQVLLQKERQSLQILTAFHVDSFFFYDPELNWQRRFKKLEYQQREQFFEVVLQGPLEVLRLKLAHDAPARVISNDLDRHALNYRYFVFQEGKLYALSTYNLKNLRAVYPELWHETKRYIKSHNFNFYEASHKMQIIEKVNDLLTTPPQQLEAKATMSNVQ